MGTGADSIAVLCVDPDGATARTLDEASDLDVERAGEVPTDGVADADCLVVVDADPATLERAAEAAPSLPRLAVLPPAEGVTEAVLSAGATDVVTDAGPDSERVLAHRVRMALDRERTIADLQETEARFEALTDNTSFAVVTVDADSVVQYASPAVEDLFGYAPADLEGEPLTTVMPERFHESHHAAIRRYLETDERTLDWDWIELPGRHRDGTEIPLGISFGERRTEEGRLFSAVVRDISNQREREERLDRMASAIEESMDGMAILDTDGTFQYVNDAHVDIYGYDEAADLLGETWHCLYSPAERERFESEVMPELRERGQWRGEATGLRADGSTFPQELSLTELEDGLVCVVRNVADRVQQRRRLREERRFVESVIDTLPDLFYLLDTDGTFRRWNDRVPEVTGYTDEELDGMHALELIPPEDRDSIGDVIGSILTGDEAEGVRSALLTKQGDRIPYEFSGNRVVDADGEIIGLTGIGRDVTEEQLREQRLAVLSRVLRHNVRNRMNVVRGRAEYVGDRVDDRRVEANLDRITAAADDLVEVSDKAREAEQLLRADGSVRGRIDLSEAAAEAVDAIEEPVDLDRPRSAPVIGTDTVVTAIEELVRNAIDHTEDCRVRVTVERGDGEARVVVADDGPGIPEHELAVLTSAEESPLAHSTGLGLWLVSWIVTTAGGRVEFRESEWGGSAVVLSFPSA